MKARTLILCAAIASLLAGTAAAQPTESKYPGRPRYPEGLLSIRLGGGVSKYAGEFTDGSVAPMFAATAIYSVFPSFGVGLHAQAGQFRYLRRWRRSMQSTYEYQFGPLNLVERTTDFSTYQLELHVNFFPRQALNGYFLVAGGATLFDPQDYRENEVTDRPKSDKFGAMSISAGLGADLFLTRWLSLGTEFRYHYLNTDKLDAFPSGELAEKAKLTDSERADEGGDSYFTLTAGLKAYIFENNDIDGDLLLNAEEETLGSNPYDVDTDGDGLSDYEEVRIYNTNPTLRDTDGDGLNDYVEVIKYRTDPRLPDTDGDGLNDGLEVNTYTTDPLAIDTDKDTLNDGLEVRVGTNPLVFDSDRDGLSDGEEVNDHRTLAMVADSDGDGLSDAEEIRTWGTNPNHPDSDEDGLTDGEEVRTYHTNPKRPDTDGDSLTDYAEIREIGTDPLKRDTDSDGIPDNLDKCPLQPETYNGWEDSDGCPDIGFTASNAPSGKGGSGGGTPGTVGKLAVKPGGILSFLDIDTVRIYEGSIVTLFGVNFEVDKDEIRPESVPILEENARIFSLYPTMVVEIRGHTDSDASDEHNLDLSERRAKSVRNFLINFGIAPDRMRTRGFGEHSPIAPNTDVYGKARNRRIEFYIVKLGRRVDEPALDPTRQAPAPGR